MPTQQPWTSLLEESQRKKRTLKLEMVLLIVVPPSLERKPDFAPQPPPVPAPPNTKHRFRNDNLKFEGVAKGLDGQ